MYSVRLWSVRHARGLNAFYRGFEAVLVRLSGLFRLVGYERLERPVAAVEKAVKGVLFDCRMCGQCVLTSTGMACPMNCPKTLRNGPCGGVRADGNCEVKPAMRCVWVEAYRGSLRMPGGVDAMRQLQFALDQRQQGRSSWLRVVREKTEAAPVPSKGGAAKVDAAKVDVAKIDATKTDAAKVGAAKIDAAQGAAAKGAPPAKGAP
jgi:hypothetical protein